MKRRQTGLHHIWKGTKSIFLAIPNCCTLSECYFDNLKLFFQTPPRIAYVDFNILLLRLYNKKIWNVSKLDKIFVRGTHHIINPHWKNEEKWKKPFEFWTRYLGGGFPRGCDFRFPFQLFQNIRSICVKIKDILVRNYSYFRYPPIYVHFFRIPSVKWTNFHAPSF